MRQLFIFFIACIIVYLQNLPIHLHNAGVKGASDKKILVDMLIWAVDNPLLQTIYLFLVIVTSLMLTINQGL